MLYESGCILKIGTVNSHLSRANEHSKTATEIIRKVKHRLRWHITCDHEFFSEKENRPIMLLGKIRNRLMCRFRKGKLEL